MTDTVLEAMPEVETIPDGFYLISDFHVDMNALHDPKHVGGEILHRSEKVDRVVKQIYDWDVVMKDYLVAFVGDTSNSAETTEKVWVEASQRCRVLGVAGNHEYYMPKMRPNSEVDQRLGMIPAAHDRITLLSPGTYFLDGKILYLGCTGWYNWDACPEYSFREEREFWQRYSNDSRMPQYDGGYPDALARGHTDWLIEQVKAAQDNDDIEKIVILTHTCPNPDFLVPPDHDWYPLNGSYANSFMAEVPIVDLKKKIKIWGYGHTHFHGDQVVDGIRYICNARGYRGEMHSQGDKWRPKWISL